MEETIRWKKEGARTTKQPRNKLRKKKRKRNKYKSINDHCKY